MTFPRRLASVSILLSALVVASGLAGAAGSARAATATGWRTVGYGGVSVRVPATWPVRNLQRNPSTCVRFDVHAVYLGPEGPSPDCPARVIGRTEAVWIRPLTAAAAPAGLGPSRLPAAGGAAVLSADPAGGTATELFPGAGVAATVTGPGGTGLAARILRSLRWDGARSSPAAVPPPAAPAAGPAAGGAPTPALPRTSAPATAATIRVAPTVFAGQGFDACVAPPLTTMQAWLASPYRAIGIYVGGVNEGCAQPNLSPAWTQGAGAMGWSLFPIYVGRQAPCAYLTGVARITASGAARQGRYAADDAAAQLASYGLPHRTPVYFDLEAYNASNSSCSATVERFLNSWTAELHRDGYRSGVYSNSNGGMATLAAAYASTTFHRPDDIWIANWNGVAGVFGDPVVPDTEWAWHQRLHQYQGGHPETYGGITIDIDGDFLDGNVVGPISKIAYDTGGAGNALFVTYASRNWSGRTMLQWNHLIEHPVWSPDGSQVALDAKYQGHWNIFAVRPGGTGLHRVTNGPRWNGDPSWSPTGTALAFVSNRTGTDQIYVKDLQAGSTTRLTTVGANTEPAWSPDGQSIVFSSNRTGSWNLWQLQLATGTLTQLTADPSNDVQPAWSPDGSQIAFASDRTGNWDIWLLDVATGAQTQVTTNPASDTQPVWSPDGRMVAFVSDRSGVPNVWAWNVSGGLTQLTDSTTGAGAPSWHA